MLLFSATGTYGPGFCWAVHNDFFCQNWWVVIGGGRCLGKIVGGHPNLVCCQSNAWVHEGDNFDTMTRGVLLFALRRIAKFCTHVSIARDYQGVKPSLVRYLKFVISTYLSRIQKGFQLPPASSLCLPLAASVSPFVPVHRPPANVLWMPGLCVPSKINPKLFPR